MPSRASNAVLMVDSREARDIEISLGSAGLSAAILRAFVGIWGKRVKAHRGAVQFDCRRPRKRVTQYSVTPEFCFGGRGVLDAPLSRDMTAGGGGSGVRRDDETLPRRAQPLQKSGQVIGDVIDMFGVAAF